MDLGSGNGDDSSKPSYNRNFKMLKESLTKLSHDSKLRKSFLKKMNLKNKKSDEMLDELKNKGITVSGKSDRLVRDIYMCIMNDNIEIKKE